jgi:hypothetical protein
MLTNRDDAGKDEDRLRDMLYGDKDDNMAYSARTPFSTFLLSSAGMFLYTESRTGFAK